MSVECECTYWCDLDMRARLLTGHHANCFEGRPQAQVAAAMRLIAELASGMESWAADEDGIHPDCWMPYCKAKALEGVFLDPTSQRL